MAISRSSGNGTLAALGEAAVRERNVYFEAWRRFARYRMAVVGLAIVLLYIGAAVGAPIVAPDGYNTQRWEEVYLFPSLSHPFGTDPVGRDLYSRMVWGIRPSLAIGFIAQLIGFCIGVPLGVVAGYFGKTVDFAVMRVVEVMMAIPQYIFSVLILASLGGGLFQMFLAMGVSNWVGFARMSRGQILSLRETEYVLAARALGASSGRIMRTHLLPNALSQIVVMFVAGVAGMIMLEAGLSFLGLGLRPPMPSLGQMVTTIDITYYWFTLIPAIFFAVLLMSFTWVADGLRNAVDPRA